jgi:hypothetical protein
MSRIITNDMARVFDYEIRRDRIQAREDNLRADHMADLGPMLANVIDELARVVERTRPTVLPMTWTSYSNKLPLLWVPEPLGMARPTVTLPLNRISWSASGIYRNADSVPVEITGSSVTLCVISEPCWSTYKRWSSVIIDDFYRAMLAVRRHWGVEWRDISKVKTEYSWDSISMRYQTRKPVHAINVPVSEHVDRYSGEVRTFARAEVFVYFALDIPTPPEAEKNAANCHVVEETVTVTTTKKVKTLKCM